MLPYSATYLSIIFSFGHCTMNCSSISSFWIIPNKIVDNFEGKIDNLHRTDDGESSQQSHRATN